MNRLRAPVFGMLCLWLMSANAIEQLTFTVDSVQGVGWRAEGLQWTVRMTGESSTRLTIRRLALPAAYGELTSLEIDCPGLKLEASVLACPNGQATARAPWLADTPFKLSFSYQPASQNLSLTIKEMPAFGGLLNLQSGYAKDWSLSVQATHVMANQLTPWLSALDDSLQNWQLDGKLDVNLQVTPRELLFRMHGDQITCSDDQGHYATEALKFSLTSRLQRQGQRWQGQVTASLPAGQAYVEPVFVDLSAHPARLSIDFSRADNGDIHVTAADIVQDRAMKATVSGSWIAGQLQTVQASVQKIRLASAYGLYLKPFLLGTAFEAIQAGGEIDVDLRWSEAELQQAKATLRNVILEDSKGRFAWDGLQGSLHWRKAGEVTNSRLTWAGGAVYKLLLGPSMLEANLAGMNVRLTQPMMQPLLEGALVVRQFSAQNLGQPDIALKFDGEVQPLSLEALTAALSWPRFGGKLSGRLPDLDYRGGVLTVGGALQAQVFDGEVNVENLRVQDPFGRFPQLFANLRMRNLDLEAVTQAFSFGRIQGRLDVDVKQMQMLNWQPVAFDAQLFTPENDKSRHRISQRAIENISAIGGGGAGALLSRGFLQFFEDFAYDRIGLSCRLRGGVCLMNGLGPSKDGNGYVLVKGRLLPRIDVIGYAREVDWATLVEQLKSVTKGDGPVLK